MVLTCSALFSPLARTVSGDVISQETLLAVHRTLSSLAFFFSLCICVGQRDSLVFGQLRMVSYGLAGLFCAAVGSRPGF